VRIGIGMKTGGRFAPRVPLDADVNVPAARAVLRRQMQGACEADGLGNVDPGQPKSEKASFHVRLRHKVRQPPISTVGDV
jgi:hypothetical protein